MPKKSANSEKNARGSRRWVVVLVIAVVAVAATGIYLAMRSSTQPLSSADQTAQAMKALDQKLVLPAVVHRPRPVTLDPAQFKDPEIRRAYEIARANPDLLEKMPCYCGCYGNSGHTNNLDCFVDRHGET